MTPNKIAQNFLEYVNSTGSPYHSVKSLINLLHEHQFSPLDEKSTWKLMKGGKYYVTRNQASILAFIVGKSFNAYDSGILMACGHTDSPVLHLKPNSNLKKQGYFQLNVECFGGGLWGTWFDRGLGLAGKIIYKSGEKLVEKLVHIKKPIAIIPSLPIHLRSAEERTNLPLNLENHINPVMASTTMQSLEDYTNNHISPVLLKALSQEISCNEEDIMDLDLCLMDATESRFCGYEDEFVESPRLDNLASTWTIFSALADTSDQLTEGHDIYLAGAFNDEEIGSMSFSGAFSNFMQSVLDRTLNSLGFTNPTGEYIARSFLISSDMGHGIHPNYPEKYQSNHILHFNKGIGFKSHTFQKYTTTPSGASLFKAIADKNNVPCQTFVVKNDSPCGSTIGPILSSHLGVKSIDIGIPQWAMHSIREVCASRDLEHHYNFISAFYKDFREVESNYSYVVGL